MNNSFLIKLLEILMRKLKERRWRQVITCLAAVVVFTTTYALILPAISMSTKHPSLQADELVAWSGEILTIRVEAEAEGEDKLVLLSTEGENADLSEAYEFNEDGIAVITDDNGKEIELYRSVRKDNDAVIDYWFLLPEGEETSFTLDLTDRFDLKRYAETTALSRSVTKTKEGGIATAANAEKENASAAAGAAAEATASDAEKASASDAGKAAAVVRGTDSVRTASASSAEKASVSDADNADSVLTEVHDDGFTELLDGAILNDLGLEEEGEAGGEEEKTAAALKLSIGSGSDLDEAIVDINRNAEKRGDAELTLTWKVDLTGMPDMIWEGNGVRISVSYDENAWIPDDAVLAVREITEDEAPEEYGEYLAKTGDTIAVSTRDVTKKISYARFFDISILSAEGNEMEPAAPVKVSVVYDEQAQVSADSGLQVLHFTDETEVLPREALVGEPGSEWSFQAESFSVYAFAGVEEKEIVTAKVDAYYVEGVPEEDGRILYRVTLDTAIVEVRMDPEDLPEKTLMRAEVPKATLSDAQIEAVEEQVNRDIPEISDSRIVLNEIAAVSLSFLDSEGKEVKSDSEKEITFKAGALEERGTVVAETGEISDPLRMVSGVKVAGQSAVFHSRDLSTLVLLAESLEEKNPGEHITEKQWIEMIELEESGFFDPEPEEEPSTASQMGLKAAPMRQMLLAADNLQNQIQNPSSSATGDGLTLTKTAAATGIENVFDITLTATVPNLTTLYSDPNVAVVLVLDCSSSMAGDRIAQAKTAGETFIKTFASKNYDLSYLGIVEYNRNAHIVQSMGLCKTSNQNTYINALKTNADTYIQQNSGTNMEGGLKLANQMLSADAMKSKNKFVIFLTDGLPSTYCNGGGNSTTANGYAGTESGFKDGLSGKQLAACNYTDTGAQKARTLATTMKNNGITIYSVGVALNKFQGYGYITNPVTPSSNLTGDQLIANEMERAFRPNSNGVTTATVENKFTKINSYNRSTIAKQHWEIGYYQGSYHNLETGTDILANWLKYSIGSNVYFNANTPSNLTTHFTTALNNLISAGQTQGPKAWTVSDPMGENIELIGLYNKDGTLVSTALDEGTAGNIATNDSTINWRLGESKHTTSGSSFVYTLKYRVRLKNEVSGFQEFSDGSKRYPTNGTTTLSYQVISGNNFVNKTKNFNVPSVRGYLTELTFYKKDQFGRGVGGAVFKLEHDTSQCTKCKGNNTFVAKSGNLDDKTATSSANESTLGKVTFSNIPSGHIYKLTETSVPSTNYTRDTTAYKATAAYDSITVNLNSNTVTNPVITSKVKLKKIDGTNQAGAVLPGAEFMLYTNTACTVEAKHPNGTAVGKVTTGADGIADLGELDIGTYYLKEVKAPTGYEPFSAYVTITVAAGTGNVTYIQQDNSNQVVQKTGTAYPYTYTLTITNSTGIELPSTGGPGTAAYTLTGTLLLMGSALLYGFGRRRRRN